MFGLLLISVDNVYDGQNSVYDDKVNQDVRRMDLKEISVEVLPVPNDRATGSDNRFMLL